MTQRFLKNHENESRLFRNRVAASVVIIFILLFALIVRLFYLQISQYTEYATLSEQNRVTLLPIAPNRGLIYDRNGILLADNVPAYNLHLVPEQISNLKATIDAIHRVVPITEEEREDFYRLLRYRRQFEGVPLKTNLDEATVAQFAVNSYRFPGVNIVAQLQRHYPQGEAFAHTIGYVGRINEQDMTRIDQGTYAATQYIGKTGIEQFYEDQLHGLPGFQHAETDVRGQIIRILKSEPPIHGNDLHLSVDSQLQQAAIDALDGRRGAIVALDPSTGEILASVSQPSFDPNLFVGGIPHSIYQELLQSWERPLFNRIIRGQYPPASTVKPMLALQGLHTDTVHADDGISCPGYFQLPNSSHVYRDWKRHGRVDLHKAVVQSCDTYFYNLSNKMGINALADIFSQFGYGESTGIDLIGELSGIVPSPEWKRTNRGEAWYPGETLITSIGQGYTLVTPLQQAHMAATLANRGERIRPHLVNAMSTAQGETIYNTPVVLPSVADLDPTHWDFVQASMRSVTSEAGGTAFRLSWKSPNAIAGKTGTAQVFSLDGAEYDASLLDERLHDHSLFVGYAPADDPQIAVGVIIENSYGAADAAALVMDDYLARTTL